MNNLPDAGFLRLKQIIGDKKANPPIPPLIPIGRSSWLDGVKVGRYPKPVKLGPKTTAWRVEDIRKLLDKPAGYAAENISQDKPNEAVNESSISDDLLRELWLVDTFIERAIVRLGKSEHIISDEAFKQLAGNYKVAKAHSSKSLKLGSSLFRTRATEFLRTRPVDAEVYESWQDIKNNGEWIGGLIKHEVLPKFKNSKNLLPKHKERLEAYLLCCQENIECRGIHLKIELLGAEHE